MMETLSYTMGRTKLFGLEDEQCVILSESIDNVVTVALCLNNVCRCLRNRYLYHEVHGKALM